MTELNERQIANLTAWIIRQMLWDPELLRAIARGQVSDWSLKEYYEMFPEEAPEDEESI